MPIVGHVADVLDDLIKLIEAGKQRPEPKALSAWWAADQAVAAPRIACATTARATMIKPQFVLEKLYEITKGDAIVTSDVGQHQMWAAQFYKFDKPRRWINSGGLGTMGFGLPAAMGAQLANPGATVAVRHRRGELPDVHPGTLDLQAVPSADQDRQPQQPLHGHGAPVAAVLPRQPLFRVVHGCAARFRQAGRELMAMSACSIDKPADVEPALKEAFKRKDELVFLDFITDQTENVYPMVGGGKGLTEMILAEEL